jgi:hypothetical protein
MLNYKYLFIYGLALLFLSACGGGGSDSPSNSGGDGNSAPTFTGRTLEIDASSRTEEVFLDLATGSVLTKANISDPASSMLWDVALQRFNIRLNGGVGGVKGVRALALDNNKDLYDSNGQPLLAKFLEATANNRLPDLLNATLPNAPIWVEDRLRPAIQGDGTDRGWWLYNSATNSLSANTAGRWLLRLAAGNAYAKMRVLTLDQTARAVTLAFRRQLAGESSFGAEENITLSLNGAEGEICLSINSLPGQSMQEAACASGDWDLRFVVMSRNWALYLNGGVSRTAADKQAAAFGIMDVATSDSFASGSAIPLGRSIAVAAFLLRHRGMNIACKMINVYIQIIAFISLKEKVLSIGCKCCGIITMPGRPVL